ncbi:MAG: hypothetical protein V3W28_06525 [Thermoplasmata archaeon]
MTAYVNPIYTPEFREAYERSKLPPGPDDIILETEEDIKRFVEGLG